MKRVEWLQGRQSWHRGVRVGALVVQLGTQGDGAPLFDGAYVRTGDGRRFVGTCVRLRAHAETGRNCPALVVAWREKGSLGVSDRVAMAVAAQLPRKVIKWAVIRANAQAARRFPDEHAICDAGAILQALNEDGVVT